MVELKKYENENSIYKLESSKGNVFITRTFKETKTTTKFTHYTHIDTNGDSNVRKIDATIGEKIIKKAAFEDNISSALIVVENIRHEKEIKIDFDNKTSLEHLYTSTGNKFLFHKDSINSFKRDEGKTIISTHISPEGACNLKCPYCSVAYRTVSSRIELEIIRKYINILKERGLKAVILTGGGEPTLYPQINELIEFIYDESGLELAMITNGTMLERISPPNRCKFKWLRISINIFDGWEDKINVPVEFVNSNTVIGFSYIYTSEHNFGGEVVDHKDIMAKTIKLMDKFKAKYLRILPNCLVKGNKFDYQHKAIDNIISSLNDKRVFHQLKNHIIPEFEICYQSYFRPYLSEEKNPWNNKPGCVFPCDSIVLNHSVKKFTEKYALCEPERIGDYLDEKIQANFDPVLDCHGCVFTANNKLLSKLIKSTSKEKYQTPGSENILYLHKNFV